MAFRLHTFDEAGLTVNPTLRETLFIVWSQAELDFSIVAATIPTLRRFVSGLATYYGALDQNKINGGSGYEIRSEGEINMTPLTSTIKSASREGRRPTQSDAAWSTPRPSSAKAEQSPGHTVPPNPTRNRSLGNNTDQQQQVLGRWNNNLTANEGFTATHVLAQDSNSVGSNDSQQMIITKDITWTVENRPNSALLSS